MAPPLKPKQVAAIPMAMAGRALLLPLFAAAALAGAACITVGAASAQDIQRIAAIVNDEVVSRYDVQQRIQLVIATSGLKDTEEMRRRLRQQVLRGLIDENLKNQAAKSQSIKVDKADLDRAFGFIEQTNKVPRGQLGRYLKANQIPEAALEGQLRAEIAWSKLVRRRLGRSVQIGDEEIDEVLARLKANAGRSEHRISEIFLSIDTPEQEDEVRRTTMGLLQQLRDGAAFAAMARQFSRGATAAQGGAVGWVQPGQLSPILDQAIANLQVEAVSEPIRAAGGFYLLQLHERREIAPVGKSSMKLSMKQIILPPVQGADAGAIEAQKQLVRAASQSATGCAGIDAVATQLQAAPAGDLGTVALTDLPENIGAAVKDLAIGRLSAPISNQDTVMLLMVCTREEIKGDGPSRESIVEDLTSRRLATLAERYLRDLRRSAVVELR
ncbi:MAG: peptidylprolyl isomerase [Proteobacteria bacterium]|nr:peptidylprolyl isomerase [Pseudomonadota bacterium]